MKRTVLLALSLIALAGLTAALLHQREGRRAAEADVAAARAAGDSLRGRYAAAVGAIVEIQDSLAAILPSESDVLDLSRDVEQDLERGSPLTLPRKEQVLRSISDLNAGIESSKALIRRLEERLNASQIRIEGLERLVENLKQTVGERERTILALRDRVDSLATRVVTLEQDVAASEKRIREHRETIRDRERELSTVYYAVGNRASLIRLGLLRETGGFIGFRKRVELTGDFDPSSFEILDTASEQVLRIAGRKPRVLTPQSRASYELVALDPDWSELRIRDPLEFRRVRYLVVQVD